MTEQNNSEKPKQWVNPEKAIKNMKGIVLCFVTVAGVAAFFGQILTSESNDLRNVTTLAAEVIFGIFIALVVYVYTKKWNNDNKTQQDQITNLITEIREIENRQQKIIHDQEEFRKRRHDYVINRLKSDLPQLKRVCNELDIDVSEYHQMPKRTQEAEAYALVIESEDLQRNYWCDKIDRSVNQSVGILDPAIIDEIQEILKQAGRNAREVTPQGISYNLISYKSTMSSIDTLLSKLPNVVI